MAMSLVNIKDPETIYLIWKMNKAFKRSWKKSHYYSKHAGNLSTGVK